MTVFVFANSAVGELAQAATGVDATLQLESGQGALFPGVGAGQAITVVVQNEAVWEIMHVTGIVGDILTVTRARDGTSAQNFPVGSTVEMRVTKGLLDNFLQRGQGVEDAFPSGTRMLFHQTAAPTSWVKDTNPGLNDVALRVVTGAVTNGGSLSFLTAFTSRGLSGSVQFTTLTGSQIPSHGHAGATGSAGGHGHNVNDAGTGVLANGGNLFVYPSTTDGGNFLGYTDLVAEDVGDHNHSIVSEGGGSSHNHGLSLNNLDLNVKYTDVIVCQKA